MTTDEVAQLTLWIQAVAIVVAVGASLVALHVSSRDRKNARDIAADDRRASLQQSKLMFDLDALLRLLENRNRGGTTDTLERDRMGAETLTLVGLLGSELLPTQWERQMAGDDELQMKLEEPDFPRYKKDAIETQLALNTTLRRIQSLVARD